MDNIARDDPDIKVFTDGSELNSNIGASAMLYRNDRRIASLQYKLELISHHTIYEGEATSILLAIKLITKEVFICSVIIYVDSRALILTLLLTADNE